VTTVKRPSRLFSFTDWNKTRPKDPPPGDRLDAMFSELASAIVSTQEALAQIRRDDGGIRNNSIGREHIVPTVIDELTKDLHQRIEVSIARLSNASAAAQTAEQNSQLFAKDAEAAVDVAKHLTSGMAALRALSDYSADISSRAAMSVSIDAVDAENWADYAQAQAENAIAAKNEALQWAEYLAGPVVDASQAPAYIAGTPFPHGLYYQPVEGGIAGLWSAKWWALYAQQLVGTTGFYYLGAWDAPPLPGEQNPDSGQMVPDPLAEGSLYYNTSENQLYFWNGSSWQQPVSPAATVRSQFVYLATANQKIFSGNDLNGHAPSVGSAPSDVFVNGVRLIPVSDYQINSGANTLTLTDPVAASSMVQWDLLLASAQLAPGAVNAWKIKPLTPDGTTQDFPLQYVDGGGATVSASVGSGAQLMVSLDGVIQETGADYTASGSTIHFALAPDATSHLWIVWYQPGVGP
jgi:hypothetical protein